SSPHIAGQQPILRDHRGMPPPHPSEGPSHCVEPRPRSPKMLRRAFAKRYSQTGPPNAASKFELQFSNAPRPLAIPERVCENARRGATRSEKMRAGAHPKRNYFPARPRVERCVTILSPLADARSKEGTSIRHARELRLRELLIGG